MSTRSWHPFRFGVSHHRFIIVSAIASAFFLAGCGSAGPSSSGSTATSAVSSTAAGASAVPAVTTISPSSSITGAAPFTLTINGKNFTSPASVKFGGTTINNIFGGPTQLLVSIPAAAIASAGTLAVTVTNPAPGGTSNAVNFSISNGPNPIPAITSLSPVCAPVGAQSLSLEVNGSNFVGSSVVRWNGSDRPTTVYGGADLVAQIPASDIAAAATATVTVVSPAPGGGSSTNSIFTIATGGVSPQSIVVDPAGKFAYVANEGCPGNLTSNVGNVSMYSINPATGALTSLGSPVAADFAPLSAAVDPSGKFAYVANSGAGDVGSVSMYTINAATGVLQSIGTIPPPCAPPPSPGSCSPYSVAVHPSGKFAYVANEGGGAPTSVSMYTINTTTGALTFLGTIAAGGRAHSVAVDPTGKFAYVLDDQNSLPGTSNSISMYTVNAATGKLTSIGTIATGLSPSSIAIDPSGRFTYVTNVSSNDISIYSIDATTGTLTSLGPFAAGTSPSSIAVDPTGKFAYVTSSSNGVLMYTINSSTGVLTSIGTIAAGNSPSSLAIDPSGKFAYVTNSGSNNISMYNINAATGLLTLIGTTTDGPQSDPPQTAPVISSLTPSSISANSTAFTLTVDGSNFVSGATILWNGSALSTSFASPTELTAFIPASYLWWQGGATITVQNTGNPVQISNSMTFTVGAPSVVISPAHPSVQAGLTQQFTAQVQNDPLNEGVVWSIQGFYCDFCASVGTIDATGKYTAPATLTLIGQSEATVTILATSVADPTQQAAVNLVLTPTPTGVFVSPRLATVQTGSSQHFAAEGSPMGVVPAVDWSVSGVGCGGAACGLIAPDGSYTAPAVLPDPSTVTVTATSATDPSVKGSAQVTLGPNPNNAKLNGQYAFLMKDETLDELDTSGGSVIVGSFITDGDGHITGGVFDGAFDAGLATDYICGCFNVPILGGNYSVGADNRGAITLILGSDVRPALRYNLSFSFALGSFGSGIAGRGQLGGGMSAGVSQTHWVHGTLALQDPAAFSQQAIAGDYAFNLSCETTTRCPTWPFAADTESVGRFTLNAGLISAGETDVLEGWQNPSAAPATLQFGGTYGDTAGGRSTAHMSFTGVNNAYTDFVFYVISPNELLLFETGTSTREGCPLIPGDCLPGAIPGYWLTGSALRRSGGTFSTVSLNGPAVLFGSDDTILSSHFNAYLSTFDGHGIVTGSGDAADQNGVVASVPFTGTYSIDADGLGRGVFNPAGGPFPANVSAPFYLVAPGKAFVLGFGALEAQSGFPFSNASLSGSYVLDAGAPWVPTSGVLSADGAGHISGEADGIDTNDLPLGTTFTGSYSMAANGEGTLTTTPGTGPSVNWLVYMVSPSKALLREALQSGVRGTLQK